MKSGATETSYTYLQEHYKFPENVFVSHIPQEIKKSTHEYKILCRCCRWVLFSIPVLDENFQIRLKFLK